jgi:hypothetical protein
MIARVTTVPTATTATSGVINDVSRDRGFLAAAT